MPKIVAEVGCNHKGSFDVAKDMIATAASFCKVDIVESFKSATTKLCCRPSNMLRPIPIPWHAYGASVWRASR